MYTANRGNHQAVMNVAHLQWMAIVVATVLLTGITSLATAYTSGRLGWW